MLPLMVTIPHSGEWVPPEATWLAHLPHALLLTDVDRFVHEIYGEIIQELSLPAVIAQVHRYAVDLNRYPEDVDQDSVESASFPPGTHSKGFHWVVTTQGDRVMKTPISKEVHDLLVSKYHDSFHVEVARRIQKLKMAGQPRIYHLDLHSMPSQGTALHTDQGQLRPDIVVSDLDGRSASEAWRRQVVQAYQEQGFSVQVNDPYKGGRITQRYGHPESGHETIQIELNRRLYMDEVTKEKLPGFMEIQRKLGNAIRQIVRVTRF